MVGPFWQEVISTGPYRGGEKGVTWSRSCPVPHATDAIHSLIHSVWMCLSVESVVGVSSRSVI